MSGKRGNGGNKALTAAVGFAAAFAARKVLHFAWKQVTGKEPPEHPEDPQVALGEAVTWALGAGAGFILARSRPTRAPPTAAPRQGGPVGHVVGVGVHMARMLATRAATKRVAEPSELE